MKRPELSVIVPVYNEVSVVTSVLDAVVRVPFTKQVIVVNDGSTDGTTEAIAAWLDRTGADVEILRHASNRGKGAAIRTGLARACGEATLVQDADLEYDVGDYPQIVGPVLAGEAEVVYGSRYLRPDNYLPWTSYRVCVHVLNLMARVLYGLKISDEATCYKVFRTEILRRMDLRCERFEFCPEVTAKAGRLGLHILEVPIHYRPRSRGEGKKIRWWDGVEAIATLFYWRVARFKPSETEVVEAVVPASVEDVLPAMTRAEARS